MNFGLTLYTAADFKVEDARHWSYGDAEICPVEMPARSRSTWIWSLLSSHCLLATSFDCRSYRPRMLMLLCYCKINLHCKNCPNFYTMKSLQE